MEVVHGLLEPEMLDPLRGDQGSHVAQGLRLMQGKANWFSRQLRNKEKGKGHNNLLAKQRT